MNWKAFFTVLQHVGIGAVSAGTGAVISQLPIIVQAIPNPLVGAVVGSALSSIYSLYSQTPAPAATSTATSK